MQDSQGGLDNEEVDEAEQGLTHSSREEQEEGTEEEEVLPWRGPGQYPRRGSLQTINIFIQYLELIVMKQSESEP